MRFALVSTIAVGSAAAVAQANLVYNINPVPNAPAVTGQIVTDGTLGSITAANIISWTYTTGSNTYSGTGAGVRFLGSPTFTATATDLILGSPSPFSVDQIALQNNSDSFANDSLMWGVFNVGSPRYQFDHRGVNVPLANWFSLDIPGSTEFVIATIPAPGAAALLGLAGLVATRRRR